jgi:hypothetical protein
MALCRSNRWNAAVATGKLLEENVKENYYKDYVAEYVIFRNSA